MPFPEKDLSEQFISSSYADVVQQYTSGSRVLYLLDALSNVITYVPQYDTNSGRKIYFSGNIRTIEEG